MRRRSRGGARQGFTILELMLGCAVLLISVAALMGAYLGRSYVDENARNLHRAMHDARRVMELIRQRNIGCQRPSAVSASGPSWNSWLANRKSLAGPEQVIITCQNEAGTAYCGWRAESPFPAQVSRREFAALPPGNEPANDVTRYDPIRVTVAVGWVEKGGRVVGGSPAGVEFTYTASTDRFRFVDRNGNGVIDSQAMLTTLISCRPATVVGTSAPPPTT